MVDGVVISARAHRRPLEALVSPAARALALLLAAALSLACGDSDQAGADGDDQAAGDSDDATGDGDGLPPGEDDSGQSTDGEYACSSPEDCVAVSSTCCGCPDFAARADSDYAAACDEVECDEEPAECPLLVADCVDSFCAVVCAPVVADEPCANGFARDSFGCLMNVCRADPPDPLFACQEDTDCTQVPADCCGCDLGGADTAVNVGQVDAHLDSLGCRRDPACPGLDVCEADQVPRCFAGGCVLASSDEGGGTDDGGDDSGDGSGDGPPESGALCGAPPFEPCPVGQVCVLNHPDAGDATQIGLGTCRDE